MIKLDCVTRKLDIDHREGIYKEILKIRDFQTVWDKTNILHAWCSPVRNKPASTTWQLSYKDRLEK